MATMILDVPDQLKEEFERVLEGKQPNDAITEFMREAVERAQLKQRSHQAIASILERRSRMNPVSADEIRAAREELRKP